VTLIIDAGPLYAQADADQPQHRQVVDVLLAERGPLVTSQIVAAEVDYLILRRLGIDVEIAFLKDLAEGTYTVECLTRAELDTARVVVEQYRDLKLGLADASLIVLAQRLGTTRILSLDFRAFRAVRPLQGGTFTLVPDDGAAT
jgi:predicted nucleic acid-binding protein